MSPTTKLARCAEHAARRGRRRVAAHARRAPHAAVGERAIGVGQREQRDVGAAERERGAVVLGASRQRVEAEGAQVVVQARDADELERAHRRHVERARERGAHAHRAVEVAVVVLRHVDAARGRDRERAVVDQRGRGQQALVDRARVQERLQRRARLPRRAAPSTSGARDSSPLLPT